MRAFTKLALTGECMLIQSQSLTDSSITTNNLPRYSIYKKTKQYKNTAIINNFKYTVLTY